MAVFSTVGGYGSGVINADGSALVDTEDGIPSVGPALVTTGANAGALAPAVVNSVVAPNTGIPIFNSVLIEIRCLNNLLMLQLGASAPDLEQMRADELFNTIVGQGTI